MIFGYSPKNWTLMKFPEPRFQMKKKPRKPPKCISSGLVQTSFMQDFQKFWIFFSKNFWWTFRFWTWTNYSLFWVRQSKSLNCFAFWLSAQLFSLCYKMDPRWPLFKMTFFVTSDHRNVIGNFRNGPVGIMVQFSYYIMTSNHYKAWSNIIF